MSSDHTQYQSSDEKRKAQGLSLKRTQPPAQIPGYETQQFLGSGAYGEVWVGVNQNTGRRVAIKFYTHRGGVDWSLLSREVEKLVFLSADRYVVQLLDVGWDADPPYYVMDYIENGSLEDLLREQGPRPLGEALELFREICVGLVHLHGKGVLHCDLKPANVLLDEDHKPRLADFGQSRLSHEQSPALGTLFYMAPEQADMQAVPDARWDVYAVGAILYCMLTGLVPHRNDESIKQFDSAVDLADRLARYRAAIRSSPPPSLHRKVPGVDRRLADMINRCLAVDPAERYSSVESVLEALNARDDARRRRPLQILGIAVPIALFLIMAIFGVRAYRSALIDSAAVVKTRAQQSNSFAAKLAAQRVAGEVDRYYRTVEQVAADNAFQKLFLDITRDEEVRTLLEQLDAPETDTQEHETARKAFVAHESRQTLQKFVEDLMSDKRRPKAASWFVCNAAGTHVASKFDTESALPTVGRNYSWRTYFHGGPSDLITTVDVNGKSVDTYSRPPQGQHIRGTHLSTVFQSKATNTWKVAISTPIVQEGKFLGLVALTVEIGSFNKFENSPHQFAVLVDARRGENQGLILQHPLFDELLERQARLPDRFGRKFFVDVARLHELETSTGAELYRDPLGQDELGEPFRKDFVAGSAGVILDSERVDLSGQPLDRDTGLLVLVQEDYEAAIGPVHELGGRLTREGILALVTVVLCVFVIWYVVFRGIAAPRASGVRKALTRAMSTPVHNLETVPQNRTSP